MTEGAQLPDSADEDARIPVLEHVDFLDLPLTRREIVARIERKLAELEEYWARPGNRTDNWAKAGWRIALHWVVEDMIYD